MPLPPVSGWLIDFRTARMVFSSGSNLKKSHFVGLCAISELKICHCEEKLFYGVPELKTLFLGDPSAIVEPEDDILQKCDAIDPAGCCKPILGDGETEIFLTGIALERGYGVISNHRSSTYATIYDLGNAYGFPVLSEVEYFHLL